jgi:hypothetical protein
MKRSKPKFRVFRVIDRVSDIHLEKCHLSRNLHRQDNGYCEELACGHIHHSPTYGDKRVCRDCSERP